MSEDFLPSWESAQRMILKEYKEQTLPSAAPGDYWQPALDAILDDETAVELYKKVLGCIESHSPRDIVRVCQRLLANYSADATADGDPDLVTEFIAQAKRRAVKIVYGMEYDVEPIYLAAALLQALIQVLDFQYHHLSDFEWKNSKRSEQ